MSAQDPPITGETAQTVEERDRDLGFGSVVSQQRHLRLLNRDGSFNVARRQGLVDSLGSYYSLLMMSWPKFMGLVVVAYIAINALFAVLYVLCGPQSLQTASGPELPSPFLRAFFFSVHTFSTIGYGNIVPVGLAANIVVSIESLFGLLGFALATGLLFARFSRPTAKILFSNWALIAPYQKITAFQFRIINARNNQIIELGARVLFSRFDGSGGNRVRKYYQLPLERERVVFFPLAWTIVHPIDTSSPLYGLSQEELLSTDGEFLILLTGIDETFSQTVHARSSYRADELIWGAKFANLYIYDNDGHIVGVDMERFQSYQQVQLGELPARAGA
jgi:inward rectifier potassium channel